MGFFDHYKQQLLLLFFAILYAILRLPGEAQAPKCRCLPSQGCWPDAKTWQAFNLSVDGTLIASKPPASPCHDPYYDQAACNLAMQKWRDPFWRADQPGALQGGNMEMDGDHGCLIGTNRSSTCWQGAVPLFAVNVSKASHVQKAVSFAAQHNLRLVIKNTGHDMSGRNTAPGSMSVWMHHLKDITFFDPVKPSHCTPWFPLVKECQAAIQNTSRVKIGAGVQWEELYQAAHVKGKIVVGAECSSVGSAGSYPQAAGHSQISPTFGLAADNILQYEVVTADGKLVVADACQNKDLFWALRGGGGATFGVVISATYATHPALESLVFASYIITGRSSSSYKTFLTKFIEFTPSLSDAGWGGSFLVGNNTLTLQYLLPNKNLAFAEKTFQPLLSYIEDQKCELTVANGSMRLFSSYYEWHRAIQCSGGRCGFPSGFTLFQASRLISRDVVEHSPSQLADALITIQAQGYQRVAAYLVAGGKVSMPQKNAVNPAWRKALLHILFVTFFPETSSHETKLSLATQVTNTNKMLRNMTQDSGSYMNEADTNEPDWQQSFFGSNYKALKAIKEKVDPKGLFVCRHCVGSEDWSEDLNCRLCRVSSQ